jgi:hypothetical protein
VGGVCTLLKQRIGSSCRTLQPRFSRWIKPSTTSLVLGTLVDMTRGKSELLAENALLRHQLIIRPRQIKHPVSLKTDRFLLLSLIVCVLPHRIEVTKGDPCERDPFSEGSLGGAYRCGKRLRMGKLQSTSCGIMTRNSGRNQARPHQGLGQQIPEPPVLKEDQRSVVHSLIFSVIHRGK